MKNLLIIALTLMTASILVATETKKVEPVSAPLVNEKPKLDGDLSDPIWQQAPEFELKYEAKSEKPVPGAARTKARMIFAPDALYIALDCGNPAAPILKTRNLLEDGPVYMDESVEIYLYPQSLRTYKHLVFGASGSRFDSWAKEGGKWDGKWNGKVKLVRGAWLAEIRIPYEDLGGKPKAGDEWKINLCRNAFLGEDGVSNAVLFPPGYHSPSVPLIIKAMKKD